MGIAGTGARAAGLPTIEFRNRDSVSVGDVGVRVAGDPASEPATPLAPRRATFRLRLGADDGRRWTILGTDQTERLALHFRRNDGGTELLQTDNGPLARRLALPIPPAAYGTVVDIEVVYGRRSGIPLLVPESASDTSLLTLTSTEFFFIGFFGAVAFTNVLLFLIFRDTSIAWYAVAMTALVGLALVNANALPIPLPIAAVAALRGGLLFVYYTATIAFSRAFLGIPQLSRTLDRAILALLALNGIAIAGEVLGGDAWPLFSFDEALLDTLVFCLLVAGVAAIARRVQGSRLFVSALAAVAFGLTFDALGQHGIVFTRGDLFEQYIFDAGLAVQAILFAFALANRTRRLDEERRRLAVLVDVDGLTGIANRRAFDRGLASAWRRALRVPQSLALLMVDVDHFKQYNDTAGHLAGDDVLRAIARAVANAAQRPDDLVARYGGEEFVAIAPLATLEDAQIIAERMRKNVRELAIARPDGDGIVTISVGCAAVTPRAGQDAQELVAAADRALYRAKKAGRDRVVAAQAEPHTDLALERNADAC